MLKEISIYDINAFQIGHAQDEKGGSGCTAVVCPKGAVAGVDVRGGGPATRETDLLNPVNMMDAVHCVMLSGGSAYGLAAAQGAMAYLEERNIGFDVGIGKVPIVPSACLFDLVVGDPHCRPDENMGYEAMVNSKKNAPDQGNVGAGTGATVGKLAGPDRMMKSGLGIYGEALGVLQVGAIVAVNALGNVMDMITGNFIAGLLSPEKDQIISSEEALFHTFQQDFSAFGGNTTIGCIITNGKMTKAQANRVALMAHDGYARVICPVHTTADGDTIFALGSGEVEAAVDIIGTLAARVMAKAIHRGVLAAHPNYGLKAAVDFL